jgi:hypothetical protein
VTQETEWRVHDLRLLLVGELSVGERSRACGISPSCLTTDDGSGHPDHCGAAIDGLEFLVDRSAGDRFACLHAGYAAGHVLDSLLDQRGRAFAVLTGEGETVRVDLLKRRAELT